MSKPRSSLIGKPDSAFRTVKGFTTAIHFGKQSKHTPGQPNHDRSKSTITVGIRDLQDLVEQKAGTGRWEGSNREVVNLGQVIGNRRDPKTGASVPTKGHDPLLQGGGACRARRSQPSLQEGRQVVSWFHPEEEGQIGTVLGYEHERPGTRYFVEFPDGESYVVIYFTSYESENSGDLDIEMDDPRYDEFHQVAMDIVQTIENGSRRCQNALTLDYRDFPSLIKDVDAGVVVYPAK